MLRREQQGLPSGGMLCDEQGLGKTATAIALIVSNPYEDKIRKAQFESPEPEPLAIHYSATKQVTRWPCTVLCKSMFVANCLCGRLLILSVLLMQGAKNDVAMIMDGNDVATLPVLLAEDEVAVKQPFKGKDGQDASHEGQL